MSFMPLVSVVMPTHNRADFVGRAIDSILNQTYNDFEFIIVDDGSTDSTSEILQKYAAKDKRIILLRQNNLGTAAARNTGVDKATGKYIAFMDDDDISLPNRLEKQVSFLEKYPDYSACICNTKLVDLNRKPIDSDPNPFKEWNYFLLESAPYKNTQSLEYILGPMACLTKKSFIASNGYRLAEHLITVDLDFTLRFLQKYKGAFIGGEYLYLYTEASKNLATKNHVEFLKRHIACYISAWFRNANMPDPVEENLELDEIISLITELPESDRYVIYESLDNMLPYIMKIKNISKRKAKKYISMITRVKKAAHSVGYFWLKFKYPGLL